MIRFLFGTDLDAHPDLAADMFRDRAAQFRDRHGWDVTVDTLGWETDQYDRMDPLYVIATDGDGGHAGSMRFLPTTGPHMLVDAFAHIATPVRNPKTWEVTRFCLSPGAGREVARTLLLGASQMGLAFDLTHAIGVYDAPMARIYRRLGWEPTHLGEANGIAAGLWRFSVETQDRLCDNLGLHARTPKRWFEQDLGHLTEVMASSPEFRAAS